MILQQLDALPTLSQIAARVLELTSSDDSRTDDVIRLVGADPALASKVLKLSRCTDRARAENITTIDRAVLHLGFDAVRSAVLSVQIFDLLDGVASRAGETRGESPIFERDVFWRHSLAVAVLTDELVRSSTIRRQISRGEAFLAGLLHDLGLLALHVLLPKSIDQACRYAETNGTSIDHACSRIIGITTHTAGKRLAERWHLPRSLGDVMWLHGQRFESLPDLPHRHLIAAVTLADQLARTSYLVPVGHAHRGDGMAPMLQTLKLSSTQVERIVEQLPAEVDRRASSLGLDVSSDDHLLLRCLSRANQSLGRLNTTMRKRAQLAQRQHRTLQAIIRFQESLAPGDSVIAVLEKVVRSAREYFGGGFFAVLHQNRIEEPWQLIQFVSEDHDLRSELITPPPGSTAVNDLADNMQVSVQVMAMLPWLSDYLGDACDLRRVRLLPLRCGWGVSAVLLHDRPVDGQENQPQLEALCRTWAAAVAAGIQHEGARALGEQLAEANRMLIEAQDELTRSQAMAALGEVVAGAAHEMNNPLTIISGRSQQIAEQARDPRLRSMADQVVTQSHRLSDMITTLRSFSEPTEPKRSVVDLKSVIVRVSQQFDPGQDHEYALDTVINDFLPEAYLDPDLIGAALAELLRNATESKGCRHIEVRVQTDPVDDRLKVQVRDDGAGMSEHTLAHAFDPFYSAKVAGRQPGLGLSQARRFVEAHGGRITLENGPNGGAIATIWLDRWRREHYDRRDAA